MLKIKQIIYLLFSISLASCQANQNALKYEKNLIVALKTSEILNKPLFINFTGYGCANHSFMDEVLANKKIHNFLNKEYVTVFLFVDEQQKIQEIDTLNFHEIMRTENGKDLLKRARNIGNINAAIQIDLFQQNSQPYYVIMDSKKNLLIEPFGYSHNVRKKIKAKLDEGLKNFRQESTKE